MVDFLMRPWISTIHYTLADCGLLVISPSKKGAKEFKRLFSPLILEFLLVWRVYFFRYVSLPSGVTFSVSMIELC